MENTLGGRRMAQQQILGVGDDASISARLRELAFLGIAVFILLGPAAAQVLHYKTFWLRGWVMYSEVGVGVLKGQFHLFSPGEKPRELSPLKVLGLDQYPFLRHYEFDRRVNTPQDLKRFAEAFCNGLRPGQTLSYRGQVGTRQGWRVFEVEDICSLKHAEPPQETRARRWWNRV